MFAKVSEQTMHRVRWAIASGWLLLIFSLFYDPISPWFTQPHNQLSPLRIHPDICVQVQGICLEEKPYPLGAALFWGAIVPLGIFILLVFGHELWRRICPLSFLSQIPRALGWQRQRRRVNTKTGKVRYELAKVPKNSWLARNHTYLQFGLLYLGICSRILFVNSNRLILGTFLISTILAAIAVGYFYRGKSWCQYFCPMAPVQKIYGEPRGLFNSKAHEDHSQTITQSMCRVVKPDGREQSACVACQSPCIDIDAERSYWDGITKSEQRWLYYSYVGLVIGYACYYYLYAGNWDYYFSGAWAHQENQLATLLSPGFYLFNHPIQIPKLLAVPLTLGLFTIGSYLLGRKLEKLYKAYLLKQQQPFSQEQIQHRIFTICTFFVFNFFFVFAGRPFILLLPLPWQYLYNLAIAVLSTLWLYRTWGRNENLYVRESLASPLRKQLSQLQLDVSRFLEGLALEDLNADEVYVLAKNYNLRLMNIRDPQYSNPLQAEIDRLQKQLDDANEANEELELLLETVTEHSTNLENEILHKNQNLLGYIAQVNKVTAAAAAVEEDCFDPQSLNDVSARTDELGRLARVFTQTMQTIKLREEQLQREKSFSDMLIVSVPGVFYLYDRQGNLVRWNERLQQVLGYSSQNMQELTALDTIVPEDRGMIAQRIEMVFQEGESSAETQLFTRTGEKIPYYVMGRRILIDDELYLLGMGLDISDRKRAEEALRIAEENYRSIFENALEGIFQSSSEGRFISVNPALARIYGYDSPQEMIESITNISEQLYVDPEKRTEFKELLTKQDTVKGFEYRCYCRDGSIIWTEIDARVVKDNNGNVLYYEGIVQDITERKRREDELRRQLEELKIEIDQKKRKEEVATLTESSYFQEVQQEMAEIDLDEFWS